MAISLRLSDEESILVKSYAALHGLSVSDLFRQAENLFQLENDYSNEEILGMEYMNEVGTDYISSGDWKWAITKFISKVLSRDEFEEFKCRCESMGV